MSTRKTSAHQLTIGFHNVGPIAERELGFDPGVNVLVGRNGIGKSTAIAASVRAFGGKERVELREGAALGAVTVNGVVSLHIGRAVLKSGQPTVELAAYSAIGDIIEPGFKDVVVKDEHRIAAILSMVPVALDDAVMGELTGGISALTPSGCSNILEAAKAVAKAANERGLSAEKEALVARGRADAESSRLSGITVPPGDHGDPKEAEAAAVAAAVEAAQVQRLADQRVEHEKRIAEMAAGLGNDPEIWPAEEALRAAQMEEEAAHLEDKAAGEAVAAAQVALRMANENAAHIRAKLDGKRKARQLAEQAMNNLRGDIAHRIHLKKLIAEPITGPTAEDVVAAAAASVTARKRADAARVAADVHAAQEVIGLALAEYEAALERAKEMRDLAQGVPARLGNVLARAGAKGITVEDSRLFATVDGKSMLYEERLSFGQKVDVAFDVALTAFAGRFIPMKAEFWAGLEPRKQKELGKAAAARGIVLVTERPTDDDALGVELIA